MTQQDDITPRVLTDDEIQDIADGFDIYGAKPEFARAIESALLSKLRAPVADERAAFVAWLTGSYPDAYSEPEAMRLWHHEHVAALAWEERGRRAALASAPVAGEAQPVAHWIPSAKTFSTARVSPGKAWEPLYAAPQASAEPAQEVAGVTLDGCLETLFRVGEHLGINYAESRKQPGSPSDVYIKAIEDRISQASNAAREEAAKLMDQTSRSSGAELIRGLKRSQADKDGGQQRNWVSDWSAAIKSLPMGRSEGVVDKSPNLQGSSVDRSTDLQGRGDDVVLPPLPSPPVHRGHALFAGSQMQTYARAAVLADRQQRAGEVPSDDALAQIGYAAAIAEVGWGEAWADLESDGDTQQEWRAGAKAIRAALSAPQAEQGERGEG